MFYSAYRIFTKFIQRKQICTFKLNMYNIMLEIKINKWNPKKWKKLKLQNREPLYPNIKNYPIKLILNIMN